MIHGHWSVFLVHVKYSYSIWIYREATKHTGAVYYTHLTVPDRNAILYTQLLGRLPTIAYLFWCKLAINLTPLSGLYIYIY